jgi:hypothetical protein
LGLQIYNIFFNHKKISFYFFEICRFIFKNQPDKPVLCTHRGHKCEMKKQ